LYLEAPNCIEWEESHNDWANNTAIRNGAEAVSRVPGVGTFAVVTRDKQFTFWDDCVYFARSVFLRAVRIGLAPLFIVDEAIRVFFVVNLHDTVFHGDTFAWEGDDTFDDILVGNVIRHSAGHWVFDTVCLVFFDLFLIFIHKHDDLTTFWDVILAEEVGPRDGSAVDYYAICVLEGVFHTTTDYVVGAIDISVQKQSTEHDGSHENH